MIRSTPLRGVEVDLRGHLVRGVLLEVAAHHHVEAFGVLAEDHEVDVFRPHVLQRAQLLVEEADGTVVDVEVQAEAHSEEDVRGVAVVGDARVSHRPEQDGVEVGRQHGERVRRQRDPRLQIMIRAPFEVLEAQPAAGGGSGGFQGADRFRRHFDADPVPRDDGDAEVLAHVVPRPRSRWR
jgi:hypothetical protein